MYYFLKKILKLETEFLEEPEALSVSDTNPAEIAAEDSADDSALSNEKPSGTDMYIVSGKFPTRETEPSSEFSEEFHFADLNSNPL